MDIELPQSPRLFLVDGYALIYRAFFALIARPLTTSRGENTSAAWGIANFLQRLLSKHKPEYLGWVHDSGLSFRHEQYPAYKATREKLTEELQSDFDTGMERICALLGAYRVPILSLPGYEADDVIGTLVRQANEQHIDVVVVSGDKDFQQLVRPGVWLLNPGRGGPATVEEQWVGVENGAERLGVPPSYTVDYLALVGDSSDNVPGVKGIGDKTARELIDQFGHLEDILAHAGELTKKRPREALLQHAENARLSRDLVTIRDNLAMTLDIESLRVGEPDNSALTQLYVELEFHSLAREAAGAIEAPVVHQTVSYHTVESVQDVERVVALARESSQIGMVVEPGSPSSSDSLRCRLVSLALAVAPGEAYYFPLGHTEPDRGQGDLLGGERHDSSSRNLPPLKSPEMQPLCELLEDGSVFKSLHDAKSAILLLRGEGLTLRGVSFDTMVASYVLDPGRRSHALDVLALELLDNTMTTIQDVCGKGKGQISFDMVSLDVARDFVCAAADMTLRLQQHFEPQLDTQELTSLFEDVEMPLLSVLADIEWNGVSIDHERFAALKQRFQKEREQVQVEIYRVAGEEFNIGSNVQLREILFNRLNLPVLKRTSTGPSTDATVLQELAEAGHELPTLLMEYRELAKLESTYLDALPRLVSARDGRIHTSFNQTVASTGRLSSSDPNLQNIPIRRELGRDIRRGFIPRPEWKFMAVDYSQIELRLLAHLSRDTNFVSAFQAGGDIHRQTAAIIFDVSLDAVTADMRGRAKTINFATIYGQGPHALSRQLGIAHAEAKEFITRYFERFVGVKRYLDSMVEFAREHGYVQTIFGRRRYIPELRERNFNMRAFGERTAANSPIQGSAADLIKIAMIRIDYALRERGFASKMLLQVHDELVFEVAPGELDALREVVVHEMEHAAALSVPLVVDVGVGDNWLETKL